MSLLSHSYFPRSMFDMDVWPTQSLFETGPSTLDLFDAFDELDRLMSRNLTWLNEPETLSVSAPKIAEKYRITLDVQGFNPNSIKTNIKDNKLVINASEGKISDASDYSLREFRKTYDLPKYVNVSKLVSFVTPNGQLVIEFPLKEERASKVELQPKVIDSGKKVEVNTEIPENIDPTKVSVTCKDRDVIVRADYKIDKEEGGKSKVHYYRRCTLPEHADLDNLKCVLDKNRLNITAPMLAAGQKKKIPVEIVNQPESQQQAQQQEQMKEQPEQQQQEAQSQTQPQEQMKDQPQGQGIPEQQHIHKIQPQSRTEEQQTEPRSDQPQAESEKKELPRVELHRDQREQQPWQNIGQAQPKDKPIEQQQEQKRDVKNA